MIDMGLLTYKSAANGGIDIAVRLSEKLSLPVGNLNFFRNIMLFKNNALDFEVFAVHESKVTEKLPHQGLTRLIEVTELQINGPSGEYCIAFPNMKIYNTRV